LRAIREIDRSPDPTNRLDGVLIRAVLGAALELRPTDGSNLGMEIAAPRL